MIENRIAEVLSKRFEEEDLHSCFLINVERQKNNKVVVYVDADDQLTIDMCRRISRFLEHKIEEESWLPEKYTLDVSSPGIDNPLRLHRQYVKNIGRRVSVSLDGDKVKGKLVKVEQEHIEVEHDKKGMIQIPFEKIIETLILVSFK